MTVTLDRNVENFIGARRQLFINGQWADAASGKTFETPNPATGETSPTSPKETPKTSTARCGRHAGRSRTARGAG
jgi:acyl-CoA reductase-like NAD-dependent aldehyde dehydrogenase